MVSVARPSMGVGQGASSWLESENVICSALMEERVTNLDVLRVATCTLCVVCAVLAAGGSFVAAALFVVAAVASSVAGKGRCGTADGTGKGGEL
ncbi:MAG: hypothetical protein IJV06_08115 [Bacteroidaceae bacterium]|nr:hypothetical protein [Bacteroidaceae bacterium]